MNFKDNIMLAPSGALYAIVSSRQSNSAVDFKNTVWLQWLPPLWLQEKSHSSGCHHFCCSKWLPPLVAATTLSTETATEIYTQCSADPPPLTPPIICLLLFWSNWNIAKVHLPEANCPIFTLSSIGQSAMAVTIERWRVVRKDILGGGKSEILKSFFSQFLLKS